MKRMPLLVAIVAAIMLLSVCASSALATTTEDASASSQVTSVAFKQINLKAILVTDEHIRVQPHTQCKWFSHFTNSSEVIGNYHGSRFVGYPDVHGYLCRDSHSPTGWVKRGGGRTGRDCGNISAPPHVHMSFPVVKVSQIAESKVKVFVTVTAAAKVHGVCGEASGSGSASDWVSVSYRALVKAKGNARIALAGSVVVKAEDEAIANAHVHCTSESTPSPVPPTAGSCNGNNTNNGIGSAGNCNTCVGVNVCNETPVVVVPPVVCTTCECEHSCKPPVCTTCECEGNCKPEPPTCKGTPEECHPKNGETGAGEGSGGPGNGCDAGYTWNASAKECQKNGSGQEGTPGGNTEGGYCRDESTGLLREAGPGESADQFGYCTKA